MVQTTYPQDIAAMGASLMYGLVAQPLAAAFGECGSLMTSILEELPLHHPHDPLCAEFAHLFAQAD